METILVILVVLFILDNMLKWGIEDTNTGDECVCDIYPGECEYCKQKIHELNGD